MHEDKINGLVRRLMTVFEDIQQYKWLLGRRGEKAQKLLDVFQMLLDIPSLEAKVRRNLLVATQRLSKNAGLYPTCYNLENVETAGEYPVAAGSFADIYKGRFLGQVVCLNIMRIYQSSHIDSFLKKFSAEAILWGQLSHANLLPIYGLYRYAMSLCLVSPWMEHGDVSNFLREHPDANRALLVADVAYGVAYLHSNDIIHGDLKGANILVNGSRRACLADFGLSAVSDANILHWTSHSSVESKGGSVRWQAPELFDIDSDDVVYNSMASDVYALSCVTYEIFTGNIPFHETPRDSTVTLKVKSGAQPSRPPTSSSAWGPWRLTDSIWTLMQMCWSMEPGSRPTVHQFVAKYTSKIPMDDRPVGSEDVITPARFRDSVGRTDPPSLDDIEDILRVAAAHPEHSPQRHLESQC
ncbi:kinase-like domain-containing protein [Lyophyllum atratum]|nr:kinase-like domain-containing protein [Lyophyllum atratum]